MVGSTVISRRSAFKTLFVLSVIPGLFLTSCTKNSSSPVNPETTTLLYKSNMDLELESAERFVVRTSAEIEIQKKFIRKGMAKSYIMILIRGREEFLLKRIPVEVKKSKKNTVVIENLDVGTILLANQDDLIRALAKIDKRGLNKKFKGGKKFHLGGQ